MNTVINMGDTWEILFLNMETGAKEERSYLGYEFKTRKDLCLFLQNRTFLKEGWICDRIEYIKGKDKEAYVNTWGKLIYNLRDK